MKKIVLSLILMSAFVYGNEFVADAKNHTVLQTSTKLLWQDDSSSAERSMSYKNAMAYCETLEYADHTDWRIPNATELLSITDTQRIPSISALFSNTTTDCYWVDHRSMKGHVGMVDFSDGSKKSVLGHDKLCHVRCVTEMK